MTEANIRTYIRTACQDYVIREKDNSEFIDEDLQGIEQELITALFSDRNRVGEIRDECDRRFPPRGQVRP